MVCVRPRAVCACAAPAGRSHLRAAGGCGQLLGYEPQQDGSHLKLGVQPQGLLMLLEEIGFIYWDGESTGGKYAEKRFGKYSLRAAGDEDPDGTGWRYTKLYSRGDFPAIKYADEAYGDEEYGF